ncbi:response regulator [Metabacillus iocasae]|uniref:Two-component SAPR family response regulator n=1 Tax=Priestia iocasae TaxID=2291674 RepID=A0ABS2QTR7_9BACI|nr:response regulator [Metabacillus iocasae]MBM7702397.1 two-component SAPR family response regulator [Metabacillus iocasae]
MRAVLIDDEYLALDYLERQLNKVVAIDIIGKYENPIVALDEVIKADVDVVFLDIQMPEVNGIDLASQIIEQKPDVIIVFVTAYQEYAVQAFELNAIDYVVKPIRLDRLKNTIQRIVQQMLIPKVVPQHVDESPLLLRLGKQITVEKHGECEVMSWRTAKSLELFLYLLRHRGVMVRKDELVDLLWPDSEVDKGYSQLYTAIYYTRRLLKKYGDAFSIKSYTEGYVMQLTNVNVDVEEWEQAVISLGKVTNENIHMWVENMQLYDGSYLANYDYWWIEAERYRLQQLWVQTALQMAQWFHGNKRVEEAIHWYKLICEQDSLSEQPYYALMQIYEKEHEYQAVNYYYKALEKALSDIDETPSASIQQWYKGIKAT